MIFNYSLPKKKWPVNQNQTEQYKKIHQLHKKESNTKKSKILAKYQKEKEKGVFLFLKEKSFKMI